MKVLVVVMAGLAVALVAWVAWVDRDARKPVVSEAMWRRWLAESEEEGLFPPPV